MTVSLKTCQYIFAATVLSLSAFCLFMVNRNILRQKENITLDLSTTSFQDYLSIPTTVGDARRIGSLILKYKDQHYYTVLGAYFATYILLQSFCIPGSIVLSILAGYLFSPLVALVIICTCSTIGATTAYILSNIVNDCFGNILVSRYMTTGPVNKFNDYVQARIEEYKSNLVLCVFMLRATPVFPNWMINLFSPIVKLPMKPFIIGTFIGVAPLSIVHVWTGRILNDLSSDQKLINWQSVTTTSLLAVSVALLIYLKQKTHR